MPAEPPRDPNKDADDASDGTGKRCPECGKPMDPKFKPFCSSRCRDVDLNRWLKGSYVIPGRDDEADGEE